MNVVDFYINGTKDYRGRTHAEILAFDNENMEACHDFIQVLFPTAEPSMFASAPVITGGDMAILQKNPEAIMRHQNALLRFMKFIAETGLVARWKDHGPDHNTLRVTRIIRSLICFGREETARNFAAYVLENTPADDPAWTQTRKYWKLSLEAPPLESMSAYVAAHPE